MKNNNNLTFWNSVSKTEKKITRPVKYGKRTFTAIDAYHQIRNATEKWGMYGLSWGLKDLDFTPICDMGLLIADAKFYYPGGGEFPIASSIKMWVEKTDDKSAIDRIIKKVDDECVKKVVTDMITKALSFVGFNADVFLGMFDDNRYVSGNERKPENAETETPFKEEKRESQWKDHHEFGTWLYDMNVKKGMKAETPAEPELKYFEKLGTSCFAHLEAFNEWLNVETTQPFKSKKTGEMVTPKGINNVNEIKSLGHLGVLYGKLSNQRIDKKETK